MSDSDSAAIAQAFVHSVNQFSEIQPLADAVSKVISLFGMTAAASGMVSGPKITTAALFHYTNWPADWVALYMEREFYLVDPVPRWARNSGRPITWSALFDTLSKRDPGREVITAAISFGFTEGMVVPTRAADGNIAAVSFGGNRGPFSVDEQVALSTIARGAFEVADRITSEDAFGQAAPILTAREIECLALLLRGHADGQIARLAGLSIRTVRFHLANARKKFKAKSRVHLGALALAQGFVTV